jgi:hypothetical protein
VLIVGAGMAGLLAGHMLRRYVPRIIEAQPKLPNNHAALLRFRSNAVAEATGIPFKRVVVRKAIKTTSGYVVNNVTLADANQYAQKVTGEVTDRSILDLAPVERYIAPEDFIGQLARDLDIHYDEKLDKEWIEERERPEDFPIVSTIPMPSLMELVGWEKGHFDWRAIWTITAFLDRPVVNVYQTIYYPNHRLPYYRASLTGHRLTIECIRDPEHNVDQMVAEVAEDFGLAQVAWCTPQTKRQEYGKLIHGDEPARRAFIMAMTDRYNLWSLGRFATWRQLLLDDVVKDIRFIDSILTTRDSYTRRLHYAGE